MAGSLEELSQVEKILSDFNISYVNDFAGKWGHRQSTQPEKQFPVAAGNNQVL